MGGGGNRGGGKFQDLLIVFEITKGILRNIKIVESKCENIKDKTHLMG